MTDEEKRAVAVQRFWELAEESLASARREFEHGSFVFAFNRIYYAAFYAVSAALMQDGRHFTKHAAVRSSLHKDLIHEGKLPIAQGAFFDRAFENRLQGDYWPFFTFSPDDVKQEIEQCAAFLEAIRPLIHSLP